MAGKKAHVLEAAALPGRKYMEDKPNDCAYCYWWKPGKKCCGREECFYLVPLEDSVLMVDSMTVSGNRDIVHPGKRRDTYGDCRYCPYGKHSPCIGFCLAKILWEMGGNDG